MIEIKEKEANKENKSLTKNNKADNKSPKLLQKNSSSGDDDCLIEDSDESDEELIEENDDDDSSENPSSSNNTNSKERNKSPMGEFYTDEVLDRYSKELMEEEEEEEENDEDYEIDENDLDILANDMNLNSLGENYNDQKTLMNTKLNMKQNMLNKKTMRNIINEMNNFKNKNKKKKITFSLENNVVSLYNSKIPITLKSKKKDEVQTSDVVNGMMMIEKKGPFDVIFMDPPYDMGLELQALQYLSSSRLADDDTLIIVEASNETDTDELCGNSFRIVQTKDYKTNRHIFLKRA